MHAKTRRPQTEMKQNKTSVKTNTVGIEIPDLTYARSKDRSHYGQPTLFSSTLARYILDSYIAKLGPIASIQQCLEANAAAIQESARQYNLTYRAPTEVTATNLWLVWQRVFPNIVTTIQAARKLRYEQMAEALFDDSTMIRAKRRIYYDKQGNERIDPGELKLVELELRRADIAANRLEKL